MKTRMLWRLSSGAAARPPLASPCLGAIDVCVANLGHCNFGRVGLLVVACRRFLDGIFELFLSGSQLSWRVGSDRSTLVATATLISMGLRLSSSLFACGESEHRLREMSGGLLPASREVRNMSTRRRQRGWSLVERALAHLRLTRSGANRSGLVRRRGSPLKMRGLS
jgi:hypothetical protein